MSPWPLPPGKAGMIDKAGMVDKAALMAVRPTSIDPSNPDGPPLWTQVDCERERRLNQGIEVFLKSGKVVSVPMSSLEDFRNLNYLATTTLSLTAKIDQAPTPLAEGEAPTPQPAPPTPTVIVRDYFRNHVELTYDEATELGVRVTDALHLFTEAAHSLKDMDPIPNDYQDDSYWPTVPLPPPSPAGG